MLGATSDDDGDRRCDYRLMLRYGKGARVEVHSERRKQPRQRYGRYPKTLTKRSDG